MRGKLLDLEVALLLARGVNFSLRDRPEQKRSRDFKDVSINSKDC